MSVHCEIRCCPCTSVWLDCSRLCGTLGCAGVACCRFGHVCMVVSNKHACTAVASGTAVCCHRMEAGLERVGICCLHTLSDWAYCLPACMHAYADCVCPVVSGPCWLSTGFALVLSHSLAITTAGGVAANAAVCYSFVGCWAALHCMRPDLSAWLVHKRALHRL